MHIADDTPRVVLALVAGIHNNVSMGRYLLFDIKDIPACYMGYRYSLGATNLSDCI